MSKYTWVCLELPGMLGTYTAGTTSIPVSDTWVSSVRHPYRYRILRNKQSERQQANGSVEGRRGALVAMRGREVK